MQTTSLRVLPFPLILVALVVSCRADEPVPSSAANGNATTTDTRSPDSLLANAAEAGEWASVAKQLAAADTTDTPQPDGMTALHWAVQRNHEPTVERLLASGSDPNAATRYRITPLSIACTRGFAPLVSQLLDAGADPNSPQPGGEMPLMIASRTGSPECVRHLLDHGAKINATDRRGQTALMWAAAEGHGETVDLLLAEGTKRDAATRIGFTAMLFAVREGRAGVVERLLAAGVDVNTVIHPKGGGARAPRDGSSALLLAVESGHFELAMRLVEAGADPNDQRSGFAPLHAMSWVRKPDRGENPNGDPSPRGSGNLTDLEFVREIVIAGADVNLRLAKGKGGRAQLNERGATPMLFAGRTADLELLELLVELGGDPLLANVEGCTPVMAAAGVGVQAVDEEAGTEEEVVAVLEYLIGLGADVNTVDDNEETAMHGAAYRNFPRAVERLAAHGADPAKWDHRNVSGWTPEMIASGKRPGSFKPSPPTIAALRAAKQRTD